MLIKKFCNHIFLSSRREAYSHSAFVVSTYIFRCIFSRCQYNFLPTWVFTKWQSWFKLRVMVKDRFKVRVLLMCRSEYVTLLNTYLERSSSLGHITLLLWASCQFSRKLEANENFHLLFNLYKKANFKKTTSISIKKNLSA
jgi:hypothetical protein